MAPNEDLGPGIGDGIRRGPLGQLLWRGGLCLARRAGGRCRAGPVHSLPAAAMPTTATTASTHHCHKYHAHMEQEEKTAGG